jgi:hypothetical protein
MRSFSHFALLVLSGFMAACSPADEAVLGDPEILSTPATGKITGPRLSEGGGGSLVLSWMEYGESGTDLKFAIYADGALGEPGLVVTEPRMFVNWADLPSVQHVSENHWLAHWLRYSADKTYSYDVVVAQSFDGGKSWSEPMAAHTDGTPTEHGFVSLHRDPEGVALLWLDGRDTGDESGEHVLDTSMTLRSAVITPDGERVREQLIDDSVCDCCQTDVALAASGPVAVYRDRTADEIRDIYVSRFTDGAWQPGLLLHADNWKIPGCPVNGPSIVAQDERVAVAWFTAANNKPSVRIAFSNDSAATFGAPVEIAAGRLSGYVGLAIIDDDTLAVSWVSRTEGGINALNIADVSFDGELGPARQVATIKQLRVFPQLAYRDSNLVLAWTDELDDTRELRFARVPVLSR